MSKKQCIALSSCVLNVDQVVSENVLLNKTSKLEKRKIYRKHSLCKSVVDAAKKAISEQICVDRSLSSYPMLAYRNANDEIPFRFLEIELQLFLDTDATKRFGTYDSFKQWLYHNFGFDYVTKNVKYYMEFCESVNENEYRAVISHKSCTLDVKKRIGSLLHSNSADHKMSYVACNVAFALETERVAFTSISCHELLAKIRRLISGEIYPNAVIRFLHPKDEKCCITWKESAENDNAFVCIEYEISSLQSSDEINFSLIDDFCRMIPNCWSFTTKQLLKFDDLEIKHRPKVYTFPANYALNEITHETSGNLWSLKWNGIQSVLYFKIEKEKRKQCENSQLSMNLLSSNSSLGFHRIIDISKLCNITEAELKCICSLFFLCEWISSQSILVIIDLLNKEALKRYTLPERLHFIRTLFRNTFVERITFLQFLVQQFYSFPINFDKIREYGYYCDGILIYAQNENEILKLKGEDSVDLKLDERRRLFTADGVRIAELRKNIAFDHDIKIGSVIEFEIFLNNENVVEMRFLRNRSDRIFANTWQEFCDNYKLVVNNKCHS